MLNLHLQFGRIACLHAAAILALILTGRTSVATTIDHESNGADLVGAEINVTFEQSGLKTATVAVGLPGQGIASVADFFDFSMTGPSSTGRWQLTNTTSFDTILSLEIDLSNTTSPGTEVEPGPHIPGILFDSGVGISTRKSSHGRPGVRPFKNPRRPTIVSSFETMPWADPMNMGDMFVREIVNYQNFGPGRFSIWQDDTDRVGGNPVPEPHSAMLLLFSVTGLLSRMRRR